MDRRNKPRGNHGAHGGHGGHRVDAPVARGWYQVSTKKGEILIYVEGGVATGYSRGDGSNITTIGSSELLSLAAKGVACPNGAKLLDEARRQPAVPVVI